MLSMISIKKELFFRLHRFTNVNIVHEKNWLGKLNLNEPLKDSLVSYDTELIKNQLIKPLKAKESLTLITLCKESTKYI